MSALIDRLPDLAFGSALVLCRVASAVMVLPGLGEAEPPAMVRAGLALGIAVLISPGIAPQGVDPGQDAGEVIRLVVVEIGVGLLLGWLARLVALALPIAGQLISVFTGLTSVLQSDPSLGAQSSAVARLMSLGAPTVMLASGLYALPLKALVGSYRLIPLGSGLPAGDAARSVIAMTGDAFSLAFCLSAPFVLAATLWQVALGLISRFVPSLQAGTALIPGQVLGGMLLLVLTIRMMLWHWQDAATTRLASLPGFGLSGFGLSGVALAGLGPHG